MGFDNNGYLLGLMPLKPIHSSMRLVNLGLLVMLHLIPLRDQFLFTSRPKQQGFKIKRSLYDIIGELFKRYYNPRSFKSSLAAWQLYNFLIADKDKFGFPYESPLQFIFVVVDRVIAELRRKLKKNSKKKKPKKDFKGK